MRMAGDRQASAGVIPPIVTRVRKEVVTLEGGDDFIMQAGKVETAALAMPDRSGEEVSIGAIPPVTGSRVRVVPTWHRHSRPVAIFCIVGSKFFSTGIQSRKSGVHGYLTFVYGVLPFGAEQVGVGHTIFEGEGRAGSRLGAVA